MLEEETPNTDFLNNIQARGQQNTLTDDINNYTPPDLSPEQLSAYKDSVPETGALPNTAYYPDINHNIAVGNYSGSEIGSTTLFAPGGGLVPIGMMDARDLAAQKAAMMKAKQIEDFRNKYKSPNTKLQTVQPKLTSEYMNFLSKSQQAALKKSGGNQLLANKMLENDPKFQERNKNYQDFAKLYDNVVDHSAQLDLQEKDPNFVVDPRTRQHQKNLLSSLEALGTEGPFSENARNIANKFIASKANYDLDKAVNVAIDKAIPNIEQLPPEYVQRGKNETATYLEKEYFTPEQKKKIAESTYNEHFLGTDVPLSAVEDKVNAMLGEKVKRKTDTYDKWFKPDANATSYDDNAVISESGENVTSKGEVVNSHTEHFVPTNSNDQKKELKFSISKDMTTADGSPITNKTGYVQGSVQGIGVKPYYKKEKRFLTDAEVKVMKERGTYDTTDDIEMKPVAVFNVAPKKLEEGDEGYEEGVTKTTGQQTIYFSTDKLAGVFKAGKKSGKDYEDMRQKTEAYAEEKNKNRKPTTQAPAKKKIAGF